MQREGRQNMRKREICIAIIVWLFQIMFGMAACSDRGSEVNTEAGAPDLSGGAYVCTGWERIPWEGTGQSSRLFACENEVVFSCEHYFYYAGTSIDPNQIGDLVEAYDDFQITTKIYRQTIEDKKLSEKAFVCELDGYVSDAVYEDKELTLLLSSAADYLRLRDEGYLVRVGDDGRTVFRRELEKGEWNGKLAVNGKGDILILYANKVACFDSKGKERKTQTYDSVSPAVAICGGEGGGFYLIGLEKGPLTKRIEGGKEEVIDDAHSFLELFRTAGGRILAGNGEKVFLYAEKEWVELFDYLSLDVCAKDVVKWWMDESGKVYLIAREGGDQEEILVSAERLPESETQQKEVVRLGTNGLDEKIQRAVLSFNRSSDKYRVEIVNYTGMVSAYSDESDLRAADERFLLDISSGKSLDLAFTNLLSVHNVSPEGVMADLNPYLEQSEMLSRDDFFSDVLEAATDQGNLLYLSDSFHVSTLLCKTSIEEADGKEWTLEKLIETAEAHPESLLFPVPNGDFEQALRTYNAQTVIAISLMLVGDNIFEGDAPEKELFVRLLRLARRAYDTNSQETTIQEALREGTLLFVPADIRNFSDLSQYYVRNFDKKDMTVMGYPTESGQGMSVIGPGLGIGILASSQHKDSAWAFIEFYLTNADEDSIEYLSSQKSVFEKQLQKAHQYAHTDSDAAQTDYVEEETLELLEEMLEQAVGSDRKVDAEILDIIDEAAQVFYAGDAAAETAADVIMNRVSLYLNENRK